MKKTDCNVDGWICTDPDCNQYRKDTDNPMVFLFKEDRLINPITKETKPYEAEIDLNDYTVEELVEWCSPYGYEDITVMDWFHRCVNLDLIAECIFEQDYVNWVL